MSRKSTNFLAYFKLLNLRKTGVWILLILLLCGNGFFILKSEKKSYKIGYIDLPKVYEKFKMKEEAVQKLTKVQQERQQILYSMQVSLKNNSPDKKISQTDFDDKVESFKEDNKRMLAEYDKEIWTQLNQYIKDYSKEKQYDILLGAEGSGTMMAANETLDATEEVITYANSRYSGFKTEQHASF